MKHHHYNTFTKRGIYSLALISAIMVVGTVGMHMIEKMAWLDAFYFMSMIATAQGSNYVPESAVGKIFASLMAFLSVGFAVAALGFLFGPFFGRLWRVGVIKLEEELHMKEKK